MPCSDYDALLIVSFGGPERPEEVLPFLERVTHGRGVPKERLLEVAKHYEHFGGRSPANDHTRQLAAAAKALLLKEGPPLPVYWGNKNWHPFLEETLRSMRDDGARRALAFVTSAFGSYSGCRQYRESLEAARAKVGAGAPRVDKLRLFFNHPGFIEAMRERVRGEAQKLPRQERRSIPIVFTAHSLPLTMARACPYEEQLKEACALVAETSDLGSWELAYQSRSGPPSEPWLGPDILDVLRAVRSRGTRSLVVVPIGFVADHMEVLWDLDTEASSVAGALGLRMMRAQTVGTHPAFVAMIRELILERLGVRPARFLGRLGPSPSECAPGCCIARSKA